MELETNLDRIKILAAEKDDENMDFRSYLKCMVDVEVLDEATHRILAEIQPQIDCTACANCCRVIGTCVNAADIARLTQALHITPDEFGREYLSAEQVAAQPAQPVGGDDQDDECEQLWDFRENPCPLLDGNLCSCYDHRPESCRSYPHLHKNGRMSSLLRIVCNVSVCPIVYNVYERLKEELWEDRSVTAGTFDWSGDEANDLGPCIACDDMGPVDDIGMCHSCAAKLDRDMIRDRAWAYSASAFGVPESELENLRKDVITRHGEKHELIASGPDSGNPAAARRKRGGSKSRNVKKKRRRK